MGEQWSFDDVADWLTRNKLGVLCERFHSKLVVCIFITDLKVQVTLMLLRNWMIYEYTFNTC